MANEIKVSKELIEVIAGEFKSIGTSHLQLAEQLFALAGTAPSVDEVVKSEVKSSAKKAPAKEEVAEETEEQDVVMIEFEGKEVDIETLTIPKLKKLAKELEVDISELGSKPKKADLIALILEEAGEEDEDENEDADDVNDDDSAEEEEEDAEETEEEEEDEEEGVDLEEMTVAELKSFIEENLDEDAPKKKAKEKANAYKERLIEFIEENMGDDEEEEDAEEEETESATTITYEDEDEEEVTVDLQDLNLKEIKALAKEFDIKVTAKKKDEAIEQFLTEWDGEEEDEEESEDLAEQLGLNDMDVEDLAEILAEHKMSTKGKKQALIARIVEGVENGDIELDEEEGE